MPDVETDSQSGLKAPPQTARVKALVTAFERISDGSMRGLPFYNEALSVEAVDFDRFGDEWLGVLITPWFMNLMLVWHRLQVTGGDDLRLDELEVD